MMTRVAFAGAICLALGIAFGAMARPFEKTEVELPAAPGAVLRAGDITMHINAAGEGKPTVVLEAGLLGMSSVWGWVQPEVAKFTRVVSYDRAGLGWSEAATGPHDAEAAARRLHALLETAGESGPYVLVGHSLGGLYVRVFASLYPGDVAGLVLVDASHPDQAAKDSPMRKQSVRHLRLMRLAPVAAKAGLIERSEAVQELLERLPEESQREMEPFLRSQTYMQAARAEARDWQASADQARRSGTLPGIPITVLTAGNKNNEAWTELQEELATLSKSCTHRTIENATHISLVTDKIHSQEVVRAIREIVEQVRETPSPQP